MKQLLEKMEVVSRELTEKRSSVSFTPKDLDKVTEWESALPESALTKYFNTWIKIHRSVQSANQSAEQEGEEDEEEDGEEEIGSGESELEEGEPAPPPKKKTKKSKKLKTKDTDGANGPQNVNGEPSESSSPDKKKKKKKKKGKETALTVHEGSEFVDNGDIVEDIVLSD